LEDIFAMSKNIDFTSCIIVAYGSGKRFSNSLNKLLVPLKGIPIFEHSLIKFNSNNKINEIILVAEECLKDYAKIKKYEKITHIVKGGKTREESVLRGLENISKKANFVLIHDAARPLFPATLIDEEIKELSRGAIDGIIPVLPVYDAIKLVDQDYVVFDKKTYSYFSKNLNLTQTPQGFIVKTLKDAFSKNVDKLDNFRDEAELILSSFNSAKVKTINGSFSAHKLTCKDDLQILKALEHGEIRTGFGYDFHPFIKDRQLIIGGIKIPFSSGLSGDSDADVLTHSIIDAILGALGMGDIGLYFGVGTKEILGVKSTKLLSSLIEEISEIEIINLDSTIICKEPKISDYSEKIIENISKTLKIDRSRINLKATTDKGFDAAGRGEGIRAITIVTLNYYKGGI